MAISKVIYKSSPNAQGETWMDLTADTVASGNLISPNTAHGADGQSITGSVGSGTEGTPIATKGSVSNHSVNITPSVTNTAGVISGGTHTGTQVTVTAAELESGTKSITQNGIGIDVTGYSAVDVAVPSGGTGAVIDVVEQLPGGGEHHIITGVDISSDTVTAAHLEQGYTAHDAQGNAITGTLQPGGGGGGGVERTAGTLTFAARTAWAGYTLDVGIDAAQFAIYATTNPLQSNGRTFQGFFVDLATSYAKGGLWVSSNSAGGASAGSFIANSSNVTKSGTVLTFKGGSSDYFQAGITYQWYAWGAAT